MVQLSATRRSFIAILWVSLVSFVAISLYVASQQVFIVVRVYSYINSVRKLLDTPSYVSPKRRELFALLCCFTNIAVDWERYQKLKTRIFMFDDDVQVLSSIEPVSY
jgi:hypothetical protein